MTVFFLGLIALAWAVFVIPSAIRARRELPTSSAERFRRGMGILAGSTRSPSGAPPQPPLRRGSPVARRLIAFKSLIGGVCVTAPLSFLLPSLRNLALLMLAALAGFTAFLLGEKRRREEEARKVSALRRRQASRRPERERAAVGGS